MDWEYSFVKDLSVCKWFIIKEMVEAAGVELFRVLIIRNLLILGSGTTAKEAPLPDPLYVYCTKIFFAFRLVKSLPQASIP
jgi:hypothetical protein